MKACILPGKPDTERRPGSGAELQKISENTGHLSVFVACDQGFCNPGLKPVVLYTQFRPGFRENLRMLMLSRSVACKPHGLCLPGPLCPWDVFRVRAIWVATLFSRDLTKTRSNLCGLPHWQKIFYRATWETCFTFPRI